MRFLILFIFSIILLTSCLGTKKIIQTEDKTFSETNLYKRFDSIMQERIKEFKTKETSKPISKNNSISLKTADSVANKKINEVLRNFNFKEKSGSNSISARYNEKTMQLIFDAYVAGSENMIERFSKETKLEKIETSDKNTSFYNSFKKDVYKKVISFPWYYWLVACLVFAPKIINILNPHISFIKQLYTKIKSI